MVTSPTPALGTLRMEVENIAFLVERLHEDCSPLQYLRELTQNGIEAISRDGGSGEIIWDVEWLRFELADEPVFKLAIIDTGLGMTGEEMERYINHLSSSIGQQSLATNYGLGAKISAAPLNPEGMIYLSWKAGQGYMTHLWKDPTDGQYGLRQFLRPDGSYGNWTSIDDDLKPQVIDESGTMVILLGRASEEDTMQAPTGAPGASRWIAKYLNTRYYRFPDDVTVRAREGWETPRGNADINHLRNVTGQAKYLDAHAQDSGSVRLGAATARWWLLREEDALTQNSGHINSAGHVAALYQDELYETATGSSARTRLQRFGILFGSKRVVIYVEPDPDIGSLTTNTARTQLLVDNEPLPWDEWAAEFRENLPEPLQDLVDGYDKTATDSDLNQEIRKRLKPFRDLFKLSRYRPTPGGDLLISDQTSGGVSRSTNGTQRGGSREGGSGGRDGDIYALFQKDVGTPAREVPAGDFPVVKWISLADRTRDPGYLEDRAAEYLPEQNTIMANGDFRLFADTIKRWDERYRTAQLPAVRSQIEDVVKSWVGQQLVEAVTGALELRASKHWTSEHVEAILSPEALTAVLMPRTYVETVVGRHLGRTVGSLKT